MALLARHAGARRRTRRPASHAAGVPQLADSLLAGCEGSALGHNRTNGHATGTPDSGQSVSAFPERVIGSACASSFSRLARRSLALRPAHSRCHQFVTRIPKASASSLPPWLLRLLPAGAVA